MMEHVYVTEFGVCHITTPNTFRPTSQCRRSIQHFVSIKMLRRPDIYRNPRQHRPPVTNFHIPVTQGCFRLPAQAAKTAYHPRLIEPSTALSINESCLPGDSPQSFLERQEAELRAANDLNTGTASNHLIYTVDSLPDPCGPHPYK